MAEAPKVTKNEKQSVKGCRIKTGTLIRYQKEYVSYQKEVAGLELKIKDQRESGEEWDEKRWTEVLEDTTQMLPNVKGKMEQATEDLEMYLEEYETDADLVDPENEELLGKAKNAVVNIRAFLESIDNTA
jgi:tubulin-specific chaperone A